MRTRSSSNLVGESSPNPTYSNSKRQLLSAPTEGYAEAIVVPLILVEHFELKYSHINMMTSNQFFRLEKDNPHDHIRWFNKITSTIKYKDVPNSAIKLMLFPFSLAGVARRWLEKEPPRSIITWEDLVSKFINEFFPPSRMTNLRNEISNFQQRVDELFHEAWDPYKDLFRACPHHGFTELHQLDTFYNALNPSDQDSLNSAVGGNLLERRTQDVLTIIENKSKCLGANGNTFLEFQDNIQGYVSAAAVNYNQGISGYRPLAITTRSGIVLDLPFVPMPPPFINPEEDERVDETLTDQYLTEYTIKVPLPFIQKAKPPSQRNYVTFLRTARALIDVHREEMILHDGDERLTLNMRHGTSSYSNQLKKESINLINIYNDSYEDYLEDLFVTNHLSSSPAFSSHTDLTSPKGKDDIFDPEGDIVLIEKLPNLDSTKDLPPPHNINPLSGSTTSSPNHLLKEEIKYLLNHDPTKEIDSILKDSGDKDNLVDPNDNLFDTIPEMFTDEHTLDSSSPPLYDDFDDVLIELEFDNDDVYNDPFDSKEDKIKESKLLIDELDP
nr:reverse transcriptase domain-containing protein [Tanacetum cinerariifolium]